MSDLGQNLKGVAHWLGIALTIISIAFVVYSLANSNISMKGGEILRSTNAAFVLLFALVTYIFASFLLAAMWLVLLRKHSQSIAKKQLLGIYARTQIYKYLPTNVLHFVGRFIAAKDAGASAQAITLSTFAEILLQATAGLVCSLPFVLRPSTIHFVEETAGFAIPIGPTQIAAICVLVVLTTPIVLFFRQNSVNTSYWDLLRWTIICQLGYVGFFILFGVSGILVIGTAFGSFDLPLFDVFAAVSLAWFLGFVVPGSPAGVGIREAALLFTLSEQLGDSTVVLAAVGLRVISVAGDLVFAALGHSVLRDRRGASTLPGG